MDKFVILACLEPDAYDTFYNSCKDITYQDEFTRYFNNRNLTHKTFNLMAYPNSVYKYLCYDIMKQPMKGSSYKAKMNLLWNFLKDNFYPLELLETSLKCGKQLVIVHIFDIPSHIAWVENHIINILKEHKHIHMANTLLVKIHINSAEPLMTDDEFYINSNCDFRDMLFSIDNFLQNYFDEHIEIAHGYDDIKEKEYVYAKVKV